jgi:biopolymer transport protein ExbB/TolQ
MDYIQSIVSTALRDTVSMSMVPVITVLLLLALFAVFCVGWLVVEVITERRHFKVFMPRLMDELRDSLLGGSKATRDIIRKSGLLLRQKRYLLELTTHPELTANMRESMAVDLEYREQAHYDGIVKITDVVSRIAPMLGLMGTLIPLGPGIMGLSTGDTETLSQSLITAFDTTTLGLMVAVVAMVISAIRKRWYKAYMVSFDAVMECVLEVETLRWGENGATPEQVEGAEKNAAQNVAERAAKSGPVVKVAENKAAEKVAHKETQKEAHKEAHKEAAKQEVLNQEVSFEPAQGGVQ